VFWNILHIVAVFILHFYFTDFYYFNTNSSLIASSAIDTVHHDHSYYFLSVYSFDTIVLLTAGRRCAASPLTTVTWSVADRTPLLIALSARIR